MDKILIRIKLFLVAVVFTVTFINMWFPFDASIGLTIMFLYVYVIVDAFGMLLKDKE